jgi:site-specific DNA-methyltransferase (adenine-specific)
MNKQTMNTMMSSKKMDWGTPKSFFNKLNKEFSFTLDPACNAGNALCPRFFTQAQDGLVQSWANETVYVNPPYGRAIKHWIKKAYDESTQNNATVVMLIPARTDTKYWHDYVMHSDEVRLVKGRLKFEGGNGNSAPFPSAVVVFRPTPAQLKMFGPIVTTILP